MEKNNESVENEEALEGSNSLILLTDEEGNDAAFEFLDLITFEEEDYIVVSPVETAEEDEEEEEAQVVILRLEEAENEEGEETYVSFDDERILQAVYEIFKEKWSDRFNFSD